MYDYRHYRTYKNDSHGRMREPIKNSLRVVITIVILTTPTIVLLTPPIVILTLPIVLMLLL
jgi:hypothetical protein